MKTIATSILVLFVLTASAQDSLRHKEQSLQRLPTFAPSGRGITFFGDGSSGTLYFIDDVQVRRAEPKQPIPLKKPGNFTLNRDEISHMPYTNIRDMAVIFPGIYQRQRGSELNIFAGRTDGNRYIIDGMWCY